MTARRRNSTFWESKVCVRLAILAAWLCLRAGSSFARPIAMTQAIMPCGLWNVGEPQPRVPSRTAGLRDEAGGAFDDKYILQQKLGDGMTACVYVATERAGGRQCACKLSERRLQRTYWTRIVQVLRREMSCCTGSATTRTSCAGRTCT